MASYNQPTNKPTRKVRNGALGGGLAAVGMGLFAIFLPEQYALVPPGMEAGLATVLGTIIAYLTAESV